MKCGKQSARLQVGAALLVSAVLSAPVGVLAEDRLKPPAPPPDQTGLPLHSVLFEEAERARGGAHAPAGAQAIDRDAAAGSSRGLDIDARGSVLVEIVGPRGADAAGELRSHLEDRLGPLAGLIELGRPEAELRALRARTPVDPTLDLSLTAFGNRVEARVALHRLTEVAAQLPDGYFITPVLPIDGDQVAGEGPAVTNSASYISGGRNGDGLTIGIVDFGWSNLTQARNNGDAPSGLNSTQINYSSTGFTAGSNTHGTGCVEAAFDHAADATYRLYKIDSITDLGAVVTDAIASGVDILSHSISWYNEGWDDDTGAACAAAENAAEAGILFFTSAGNRAESHYKGTFSDSDGNDFHAFSGGDETINIRIADDDSGNFWLSWSNSNSDFDFYLYNSDGDVVDSSLTAGRGQFEMFNFKNTTGETRTYRIAVKHRSGSTNSELEIFTHNVGTWQQYAVAESSVTSPSNCTAANVISVGAVDQLVYDNAEGTDPIESYSSQGPSNSGMVLPDIAGPTDTTGFTYPNGFGGTSSATPNAAGATAAFWSHNTNLSAEGVAWLVKEQAALWRDWGPVGSDNVYGKGGLQLIDFAFGTRWLARSYPGTSDGGAVPFSSAQAAYADTPSAGRLLMWGGIYPEAVNMLTPGKNIQIGVVPESGSPILGE